MPDGFHHLEFGGPAREVDCGWDCQNPDHIAARTRQVAHDASYLRSRLDAVSRLLRSDLADAEKVAAMRVIVDSAEKVFDAIAHGR